MLFGEKSLPQGLLGFYSTISRCSIFNVIGNIKFHIFFSVAYIDDKDTQQSKA